MLWVLPEELENADSPFAMDAAASASYLLWALSGRRYNMPRSVVETYQCQVTELVPGIPRPVLHQGAVYNMCSACGSAVTVRLRNRPALVVESVIYQGTELAPSEYELVNRAVLRPPRYTCWNLCDGITVKYRFGQPPPVLGRQAARYLANQFVCSWSGGDCALPKRLTSITRQSVSMTVLDSQDFLDQGKTGLYEVDLFLRAVNPAKSTHRSRVFSPDLPRAARLSHAEFVPEDSDLVIVPGEPFTQNFVDMPGPVLDGVDWKPRGEIHLDPSGTAVVLPEDAWGYISGGVSLTLTDTETAFDSVTGGTFLLYAIRVDDEQIASLIYTSKVFVTTHVT